MTAAGRTDAEPVALISKASTPGQSVLTSSLGAIVMKSASPPGGAPGRVDARVKA